jgi:heparan-sulfate lyase
MLKLEDISNNFIIPLSNPYDTTQNEKFRMKNNSAFQIIRLIRKSIVLAFLVICHLTLQVKPGYATKKESNAETVKLLSLVDLSSKSLKNVYSRQNDPEAAVRELLKYYRSRTFVKHPVDKNKKSGGIGKTASANELQIADNALKHIFVGQSAYPPQFCGDDINWNTRPVPDNEWVWQLNRMNFWDSMAQAYWHTGDEKYAKEWCSQLIDWTLKNPNDKEHNYAWRSIETGIRGYRWSGLFQYFIDSPNFSPAVMVAFLNSCHDHAEHLMTKYSTKSNWGLMEAEGLAFIAITFPEFKESGQWLAEAVRRLNNEIDIQVYPDGQQRELAMGYHLGSIDWFLRTYDLAKMNGKTDAFPPSFVGKVLKMCEVPLKLGHPDGTNAQFGDSWAGRPGQHNRKFQEWADRFQRKDFLFLATNGQKGIQPDSTAFALRQSGLYSMRSSWAKDAVCLILKCGPDGGGHCQPDNGTFELSAGGRNLMTDAGSFIYSGDPKNRKWFRQTKVHQTLTLNGENSKYAPKLLVWKPGTKNDVMVVENKSYQDLTHRRAVFFIGKRYFILVDEAYGNGEGNIDLHFQLAPCTAIFNRKKFNATSGFREGWNVMVQTQPQQGLEIAEEEGLVSLQYTIKEPRPAFFYRLKKTASQAGVRFVTLVEPYEKERPDVKIRIVGQPEIASNELKIEIKENGQIKTIGYTL